jgi:hypothetical protein
VRIVPLPVITIDAQLVRNVYQSLSFGKSRFVSHLAEILPEDEKADLFTEFLMNYGAQMKVCGHN